MFKYFTFITFNLIIIMILCAPAAPREILKKYY